MKQRILLVKYFLNGPIPASFSVYFCLFHMKKFKYKLTKVWMVCLGLKPGAAVRKAQTKPLSYGGH